MADLNTQREGLLAYLRNLQSCAVAYSGGVDSAVVAKAAALALGEQAVAITGVSSSLASHELDLAADTARRIGIRHLTLETREFESPDYLRNAPDRCYHCKTELYTQLERRIHELGVRWIVNGANADDLGDYRPGLQAAEEHRVKSPLAELGFSKADVRRLAAEWQLPVWDKPASPCLSSRIAYGLAVTPERLSRIEQAETWLRQQGLVECRVRYHPGDLARIEVSPVDLPKLASDALRTTLAPYFRGLGFKFVTLDLEGFRSGSLNTLLTLG